MNIDTTALDALFDANPDTARGLAAAYQILLNGVPSQSGFTALINTAVSTNFGAGPGPVFNPENIFINLFNNLVQGNTMAAANFATLAGTGTLSQQITSLYNAFIPAASRTQAGLDFFNRADATTFYTASAMERGITASNGPAVIAAAAILRIAVRDKIPGIGDSVDDLINAVGNNTSSLPAMSATFIPIETADGTGFDANDGGTVTPPPATTTALTTALDALPGTTGVDTFLGSVTGTATQTFNSGDNVNGNTGEDVLQLTLASAAAGTVVPTLSNLETVQITDTSTAAQTINMVNSTGVTKYTVKGSTTSTNVTGQNAIAAIEVMNTTGAGGFDLDYSAAVTAGTSDVQAIALMNNGSATTATTGIIDVDGIETFNVTATGVNNFGGLTGDALQTVNVDGAGSVQITTALAGTLKSYDASKSTGSQMVSFGGGDVAVKGGSAADTFNFGATFSSKDTLDSGGGTDILILNGGNFSAAANDTLKGLNAVTNTETVSFNTGATTLDMDTFTNAAVKTIQFNGAGADTVTNATNSPTFDFGVTNAGNATFTMKGGQTTLNLSLTGSTTADADVGALNTGSASTVNIMSTGAFSTGTNAASTNDIGNVTNAINSTFNVSGSAATSIAGFDFGAIVDGSTHTGNLTVTGSAFADNIKGGTAVNKVTAANGVDNIDISKSDANIDTINLDGILSSANRDIITGFKAGPGGDILQIDDTDTTAPTTPANPPAIQEINTNAGALTFLTSTNDIMELSFDIAGTTLGDGSANSLNGTNLLAAVGTLSVQNDNDDGYLVAYQGGNAYLYHVNETAGGDATVSAAEIQLVATINGVAVGGLDASNFDLV